MFRRGQSRPRFHCPPLQRLRHRPRKLKRLIGRPSPSPERCPPHLLAVAAASVDLTVAPADVHLVPATPQAGQTTTFTAVIRNSGSCRGTMSNCNVPAHGQWTAGRCVVSQPIAVSVPAHGEFQATWSARFPRDRVATFGICLGRGDVNPANKSAGDPGFGNCDSTGACTSAPR